MLVGNAALSMKLTVDLLEKHQLFVQCVQYPMFAHGKECLRVTPTPHHTYEMVDNFVASIVDVWRPNGLKLR